MSTNTKDRRKVDGKAQLEAKKNKEIEIEAERSKRNEKAKKTRRRRENAFSDPSSKTNLLKRRREALFESRKMVRREVSVELPEEMWRAIFWHRVGARSSAFFDYDLDYERSERSRCPKLNEELKRISVRLKKASVRRALDDLVHLRAVNKTFLGCINDLVTSDYDWYAREGSPDKLTIVWKREKQQ